jgi:hypothetical protein
MPSVIEAVKSREKLEALNLIINDVEAQRFMSAWQVKRPKFKDRDLKKGENPEDALMQLWEYVEVNLMDLATGAKLPLNVAAQVFNRLKENRLIYPDGTIPEQAAILLQSQARAYIRGLVPKKKAANG